MITSKQIRRKISDFFSKGSQRSIEAKRNIIGTIAIKGLSISTSLLMVPMTIHYINPTQYGIWLTISSMVAWISFFDIGFTQGLRNRFTEAKAQNDTALARIYISTTYFYMSVIFIGLWLILLIFNRFIDWGSLLHIDATLSKEVSSLAYIIFSYFCLQFVFRIVSTILIADQKPAKAAMLDLIGQIFSLIIIYLLTKISSGSLVLLGFALGVAPTLIIIGANFLLFKTEYKEYTPSIRYVKTKYAKDIMTLGLRFFILQIAYIIQYQSTLFLIAHYFDTLQVTSYNIAYKYFGILQMGFSILITPLWSGVTDAYSSEDTDWIKNAVKKYLYVLIPFILTGIIMLIIAGPVYEMWLGKGTVNISFNISLLCLIFFLTQMFAMIFVHVINGIGALKIQFYSSFLTSLGFVSFSLVLIKVFHLGIESILISSILSNVYGYIIAPVQYYNVFIKRSELKIWYS